MRLAVDMDGVMTDFTWGFSGLLQRLSDRKGNMGAPRLRQHEAPEWYWPKWYWPQASRRYVTRLWDEAWDYVKSTPGFWGSLEPLNSRLHTYLSNAHRGQIVFMTRRDGPMAWSETAAWLHFHGILEPLVYVCKSGEEKGEVCRTMGIRMLIDDQAKNAQIAAEHGVTTFLIDYPYNRDVSNDFYIQRVPDLQAALWAALG